LDLSHEDPLSHVHTTYSQKNLANDNSAVNTTTNTYIHQGHGDVSH
jgi:hypothetical protein